MLLLCFLYVSVLVFFFLPMILWLLTELDTPCQLHAVQAKLSARYTGKSGLIGRHVSYIGCLKSLYSVNCVDEARVYNSLGSNVSAHEMYMQSAANDNYNLPVSIKCKVITRTMSSDYKNPDTGNICVAYICCWMQNSSQTGGMVLGEYLQFVTMMTKCTNIICWQTLEPQNLVCSRPP